MRVVLIVLNVESFIGVNVSVCHIPIVVDLSSSSDHSDIVLACNNVNNLVISIPPVIHLGPLVTEMFTSTRGGLIVFKLSMAIDRSISSQHPSTGLSIDNLLDRLALWTRKFSKLSFLFIISSSPRTIAHDPHCSIHVYKCDITRRASYLRDVGRIKLFHQF